MKKNKWNKVITARLWGGVFMYLLFLTKPSVGGTLWRTKWERLKCYDKIKERSGHCNSFFMVEKHKAFSPSLTFFFFENG